MVNKTQRKVVFSTINIFAVYNNQFHLAPNAAFGITSRNSVCIQVVAAKHEQYSIIE